MVVAFVCPDTIVHSVPQLQHPLEFQVMEMARFALLSTIVRKVQIHLFRAVLAHTMIFINKASV